MSGSKLNLLKKNKENSRKHSAKRGRHAVDRGGRHTCQKEETTETITLQKSKEKWLLRTFPASEACLCWVDCGFVETLAWAAFVVGRERCDYTVRKNTRGTASVVKEDGDTGRGCRQSSSASVMSLGNVPCCRTVGPTLCTRLCNAFGKLGQCPWSGVTYSQVWAVWLGQEVMVCIHTLNGPPSWGILCSEQTHESHGTDIDVHLALGKLSVW